MKRDKETWKAIDRIFFGSNDPDKVQEGIDRLEKQLNWQRSSLGRYLRSLRRAHRRSLAEMAHKAGVNTETWKAWEHDFLTPSKEELESVMVKLKWSRLQIEMIWKLWKEAARFRLKRLTTLQGQSLAAKGVASEANIAWESVDEKTRALLADWGQTNGYDLPQDLSEVLSTLTEEEQREAWVNEILGGPGEE